MTTPSYLPGRASLRSDARKLAAAGLSRRQFKERFLILSSMEANRLADNRRLSRKLRHIHNIDLSLPTT